MYPNKPMMRSPEGKDLGRNIEVSSGGWYLKHHNPQGVRPMAPAQKPADLGTNEDTSSQEQT